MNETTATTVQPASAVSDLAHPKEMARHYGVSVPTFLSWFHKGWIPAALAMGAVYRFDRDEVAKAIAKRTAKQNKPQSLRGKY